MVSRAQRDRELEALAAEQGPSNEAFARREASSRGISDEVNRQNRLRPSDVGLSEGSSSSSDPGVPDFDRPLPSRSNGSNGSNGNGKPAPSSGGGQAGSGPRRPSSSPRSPRSPYKVPTPSSPSIIRNPSGAGETVAGVFLGMVAYALVLSIVEYGWSGPALWFKAKFLNEAAGAPPPSSSSSSTATPNANGPGVGGQLGIGAPKIGRQATRQAERQAVLNPKNPNP